MFTRLLASAFLVVGLAHGAYAQSTTGLSSTSQSTTPDVGSSHQKSQNLPQAVRQQLTGAGFTEVQIIPSSFLVSAKNKDGNRVMMRIGPDSMTMLTEVPVPETTGSGSSSSNEGGNSSSTSSNASK